MGWARYTHRQLARRLRYSDLIILKLESSLDSTSTLLAVLSTLNPKAFYSYIARVLPLNIGVGLLFKGIIDKLNRLSF